MSILIKGMNMPTSCPCELIGDGYDVYCSFAGGVPRYIKEYDECCQNGTRPSWCPLIEVDDNEIDEAIKALKGVRDAHRIITEVFCRPPEVETNE